jgi:osmotically inducible protein OsmC
MKILYTTEATASGGRTGRITSPDGNLNLDLALPKVLGGAGGQGTNPEQLFAAGYAACFENSCHLIARRLRLSVAGSSVMGRVHLGHVDDNKYDLRLQVELHIRFPELSRAEAEDLVERAYKLCPFSNATRGNIDVALIIEEPAEQATVGS